MPEKEANQNLTIGFIGNPNCGKTTLFNAYTGANLKVANWPGVTVEKVEGAIRHHNMNIRLVDLPGTYSLTSYTMEEIVSRQFILSDEVDVVINVVDASALERSLYLTLQLLELGKPVVMALNMMDIVEKRGLEIDLHRLPEMLGIPVIPVSARKGRGLEVLLHAAAHHKDSTSTDPLIHDHPESSSHQLNHKEYAMVYSDDIEDRIDQISAYLHEHYLDISNVRWTSIKLLEQDKEVMEKYPVELPEVLDKSYEVEIIREKYDFIEEIIREVVLHKEKRDEFTDRMDKIFTNNIWGIPVFLAVMAFIFFLTFTVGDWLSGFLEAGIEMLSNYLEEIMTAADVSKPLQSLVLDGALGGVGTIVTFLPNILILFLSLGFLEDSGYMARVAYVMENVMGAVGLSGRAFIPMLVGFGCTVPAIMASRGLENKRDRYKVMLVTPFMSCNARLTIYILFSEIFFKKYAMVAAYSMYIIGVLVAIGVSLLLHWMDIIRKKDKEDFLLIELPEYKMPDLRTVAIYVSDKIKGYLAKAGTIIFLGTIIIWFILNFGPTGYTEDPTQSFGAYLGHWMVPMFRPIGLGFWQITLALLAGISAKEVVVSSCAVLFGISNPTTAGGMVNFEQALEGIGFTSINTFCLMVFCLLYIPCTAALATIKKESGSWKWTFEEAAFQLIVAWIVTFICYHILLSLWG
jgi:ferrous iron transport protein B